MREVIFLVYGMDIYNIHSSQIRDSEFLRKCNKKILYFTENSEDTNADAKYKTSKGKRKAGTGILTEGKIRRAHKARYMDIGDKIPVKKKEWTCSKKGRNVGFFLKSVHVGETPFSLFHSSSTNSVDTIDKKVLTVKMIF